MFVGCLLLLETGERCNEPGRPGRPGDSAEDCRLRSGFTTKESRRRPNRGRGRPSRFHEGGPAPDRAAARSGTGRRERSGPARGSHVEGLPPLDRRQRRRRVRSDDGVERFRGLADQPRRGALEAVRRGRTSPPLRAVAVGPWIGRIQRVRVLKTATASPAARSMPPGRSSTLRAVYAVAAGFPIERRTSMPVATTAS